MFRYSTSAFLFERKEKPLFKLDPRVKLLKVAIIIIAAMIIGDYMILTILTLYTLLELLLFGWVWRKLAKGLLFLSPLIIIIFIANYLILRNLIVSIIPVLRFLLFVFAIDIFFLTTGPDDFSLTLEYLHLPLVVSLSFSLALRFIPTLAIQLNEIIDAQLSRGLKLDTGGFLKRIKNYLPILIPLIVISIKKSIEIAEALEIRGLEAGVKRVPYETLKIKGNDVVYLISSIIIVTLIIIIDILF